jgi:hypothetical protein
MPLAFASDNDPRKNLKAGTAFAARRTAPRSFKPQRRYSVGCATALRMMQID